MPTCGGLRNMAVDENLGTRGKRGSGTKMSPSRLQEGGGLWGPEGLATQEWCHFSRVCKLEPPRGSRGKRGGKTPPTHPSKGWAQVAEWVRWAQPGRGCRFQSFGLQCFRACFRDSDSRSSVTQGLRSAGLGRRCGRWEDEGGMLLRAEGPTPAGCIATEG